MLAHSPAYAQAYQEARSWGVGGSKSRALSAAETLITGALGGQGDLQLAANTLAPYAAAAIGKRFGHGENKNEAAQAISHFMLGAAFELHPKSWTHPLQLTRCSFFMSKYTLHFKYQAVLYYLHIRSQQRTADHYGISRTHLRRWIRAYQEGGVGALEHPQSKTMTDHRKNPFIADKPDHEKTQAELIEELCYMRAKVAYLKELKALSKKRTEKNKAKPSKH
ncbi:helix-turn-helix domain-containing protein [Neisseria lactamica]|uniref:Putative transposase n=1 Tax=Neisseria lactamica (strain 020-06) TaxID=489653 RepID=E4ZCK0_NEIL0|nr:helix-turn-helix domain-containing protein [Neisseria lactamica]CBN87079.1 putative transposase [Neisseria lactamica 020-06]